MTEPTRLACEKPTRKFPGGRTGTAAGYAAHIWAKEKPCGPCRLAHSQRRPVNDRGCLIDGCPEPHNAHGYCKKHGFRVLRGRDPLDPGAFTYSETGLCTFRGCSEPHRAKGYCSKHYQRFRKGRLDLPEIFTCERCGREYPRPYKGKPEALRYCSHECRYAVQLENHKVNRAERTAYLKEWAKRNPQMAAAHQLRRDARERAASVTLVTGRDLAWLVRRHGGMCAYCGIRPYEHFDHVVPLARGGRHSVGNLLPACAPCNLAKGSRLLADWRLRPPLPKRFRRSASLGGNPSVAAVSVASAPVAVRC
jgi:5-methylcytosine-specific restriction endonuclease McrA